MKPKRVACVTPFLLFAGYCRCGELNVHGFWGQLRRTPDPSGRFTRVETTCRNCGAAHWKNYRHTTAKRSRHRLIDWLEVGWWLVRRAPLWLLDRLDVRRLGRWAFWLECRVPL